MREGGENAMAGAWVLASYVRRKIRDIIGSHFTVRVRGSSDCEWIVVIVL